VGILEADIEGWEGVAGRWGGGGVGVVVVVGEDGDFGGFEDCGGAEDGGDVG